MIPETIGSLLGLLLVVAPGLAFEGVRSHYRPENPRSAFREAAAVSLASLLFTFASLAILAVARAAWPNLLPSPPEWILGGHKYIANHVVLVGIGMVALTSLSVALAAGSAWVWFRRGDPPTIHPSWTSWYVLFRKLVPPGSVATVHAQLLDGSTYVGRVAFYAMDHSAEERELVLKPPLRYRPDATAPLQPLPYGGEWSYVVIRATQVNTLWVRYVPTAERKA